MEGKQAPRRTSSGGGNSRQSGEELAAKSGRRAPSTQRRPGAAGSRQQHGEAAAGAGCGPRQRDVTGAHREHRRWDGGRDTPRIIIAGMAMGTYRESSSLGWRRGHRIRKEQSPQDGGRGTPRIIIAGMAMRTYRGPPALGWRRGHRIRKEPPSLGWRQRHTQDHRRWDGGGDLPRAIVAGMAVCNRDRYTAKNSRVNKISGDLRSPSLVPQRGRASPHPSSKPLRACRDNPAPHVYVSG